LNSHRFACYDEEGSDISTPTVQGTVGKRPELAGYHSAFSRFGKKLRNAVGRKDPRMAAIVNDNMAVEYSNGSYEDALALVGRLSQENRADMPIEHSLIELFASHLEDARSEYWTRNGDTIAPPALLISMFMRLPWRPPGEPRSGSLSSKIPLPGSTVINVSTDTTYFRQLRVGDELTVTERLANISALKRTRLGEGHFVTIVAEYVDQHGNRVAENINTAFRFQPPPRHGES
jgi:hypothetical protein